jgi:hypothetical protein
MLTHCTTTRRLLGDFIVTLDQIREIPDNATTPARLRYSGAGKENRRPHGQLTTAPKKSPAVSAGLFLKEPVTVGRTVSKRVARHGDPFGIGLSQRGVALGASPRDGSVVVIFGVSGVAAIGALASAGVHTCVVVCTAILFAVAVTSISAATVIAAALEASVFLGELDQIGPLLDRSRRRV